MQDVKHITIISNRKKVILRTDSILYLMMRGKIAEIHISGGEIIETRMSLDNLEKQLGEGFIKVHRGCLVSAMAIHDISDYINLSNGDQLEYTVRKKKWIIETFYKRQKSIVGSFAREGLPKTDNEYREYYKSFEQMPFAFADIEMVFDEDRHAVDWIFKYGNPKLAELEKIPLQQLIGNSFGSLFHNMDAKWLRSYERATLFGETLEMMDYSPEIDAYLKVICFPTFKGHCGCMLFELVEVRYTKNSSDAEKAVELYFGNLRN